MNRQAAQQEEDRDFEFIDKLFNKVFNELNSCLFDDKLSVELKPKLEKNLGFSFLKDTLFFGSKVVLLTPAQVLADMFHEMVHAINFKNGVKDVGTNSYHNKKFLNECSKRGFFVIRHKNHGWSLISLQQPRNVTEHKFVIEPDISNHHKARKVFDSLLGNLDWQLFYSCKYLFSSSKRDYTYKYTCSCPPPFNSIRSGRGPNSMNPPKVKCMVCEDMFSWTDASDG
jgi:hypothetical protein